MNIHIEIHYTADSKITQKGSFPKKGRKPEYIALQFWQQIKKEMSYRAELEKITVDGDRDITQLVKSLVKQEWKNINEKWDLPF